MQHRSTWSGDRQSVLAHCIVAATLFLLAGCSSKPEGGSSAKKVAPLRGVVNTRPTHPEASIKREMRDVEQITMELRRRAAAGAPPASPARVLRALLRKLPVNSFPANFEPLLTTQQTLVAALEDPKGDRITAYNNVVEGCIACHKVFAKPQVLPMFSMRIIKPPPPSSKNGARPEMARPLTAH